MKKLSIGVRLMAWYIAIFALGEILFGASMWALGWKASGVAQTTRVSRLAKRLNYRRTQRCDQRIF